MTAPRRAAAERDDSLRERDANVIERALAGEDVAGEQLAAARGLYSFRALAAPPDGGGACEKGGQPLGPAEVVRVAVECGLVRAADGGAALVGNEPVMKDIPTCPPHEKLRARAIS